MSDIAQIKERIKKLMAYANDGSATEGEIENALGHAQKLIDAHHLSSAEFETQAEKQAEEKMDRAFGKTESSKFHRWETTLASAVEKLFGCIKYYLDGQAVPLMVEGVAQFYTGKYAGQRKMCRRMCFYGPFMEAQEAAELFSDWCKMIATMGVMRWGGAYRGDGEMYCQGFADALYLKATELDSHRRLVEAKPLAALPGPDSASAPTTAITLRCRYDALQERAATWLEADCGVKLGKGSGRQGSSVGSDNAYAEGASHGSASTFGRSTKRKQLPGA